MTLSYPKRLVLLAVIAATGVVFILLGLFDLQVVNRDMWLAALEDRSNFRTLVHGERGAILDADGEILARDVLGYDLMIVTAGFEGFLHECRRCGHRMSIRKEEHYSRCPRCRTRDSAADGPVFVLIDDRQWKRMADILGWSEAGLRETVAVHVRRNRDRVAKELDFFGNLGERRRRNREKFLQRKYGWRQYRVKADVPYEAAREVALHPEQNPAFRIREGRVRRNVGGPGFAQLIGRKPDPVSRADGRPSGSGLELLYDPLLSGEPGVVLKARDRRGELRVLEATEPIDGVSVQLTIARRDQEAALRALGGRSGAIVVVDAETGAVLVAASAPSYDPADFNHMWKEAQRKAADKSIKEYQRRDPRINRALRGWYAPGSTMKPFTAIAALTIGACTPGETIDCHRHFSLNGKTLSYLRCNSVHGATDLHRALVRSCNVYFQTVMHRMLSTGAEEHFRSVGHIFGFGEPTGIELEPADWIRRMTFQLEPRTGRREYGSRLQHAIGQGYLTATPAQVARAYAGLMTGHLPRLHLVHRQGSRVFRPERTPIGVPGPILERVREALRATNDPGQSLASEGLDRFEIACKTGTAQTRYQGLHTGWIAGFGEARGNRPPIAFAVVVEFTTQHGGHECGPVLRNFLDEFYRGGRQQ